MWQTFGHNPAKQLLEKQLQRGIFPHAYLFIGPSGIGKKTLAREFAGKILNAANPGSHTDYIYYDAGSTGMEELRQFLGRLGTKPFAGKHKVAIIDNMDLANPQMGNALLKTLEEPSPSTILVLIASRNNLLPTIVSRCQVLSFNPLSGEELMQYAGDSSLDDKILAASFGSPARLNALLQDPDQLEEINAAVVKLEQANSGSVAERMLAVTDLAELEPEQLREILLVWLYRQRAALANEPGRAATMSAICETLEHLNGMFNKKMALQRLLLQTYEMA